ncbi:DUF423 domain-containing protein [Aliidiomarina taiwanensis]|uniref:DUF423 domain-containing protein n=1 Tax=Aliidiomarina taiwanensis TaxID=946228 RepID=A0A432XAR7_9GAMM|nr:DUF423 domain-containing protein [Aliidiomarina taiwanensis]RUO44410.1 DUF423 domain-containing protein [Aliidiomarina taiwanensis]
MTPFAKFLLVTAALLLAVAVMLGAFGAHALRNLVPEPALLTWQTGVLYQFIHALGIALLGVFVLLVPQLPFAKATGSFFLVGILCFSGSLYALVLTEWSWVGPITPLGGLCFIVGWVSLAGSLFRLPTRPS